LNKKVVATSVFAAIASTASLYSKALAIVVDFHLDDSQKETREALAKAVEEGLNNDAKIYQLVREALRLNPPVPIITRTAKTNVSLPDHQEVKEGQRVVCSIIEANTDEARFGESASVADPNRHASGITGFEEVGFVNSTFFKATLPGVLRIILKLKNIQRAPGAPGHIARVDASVLDCPTVEYTDLESRLSPWPASLSIQFDA